MDTKNYVEEYAASREAGLAEDMSEREDACEVYDEMPLSVEVRRSVRIMLGYGGPTDWLDVLLDSDGDIDTIHHTVTWGSDRKTVKVTFHTHPQLWALAEYHTSYLD